MSKHVTLDQRRAKHAWDAVKRIRKKGDTVSTDYKREVKRLPVRIQTAGLGQALGFLYAKAKSDSDGYVKSLLLKDLEAWLLNKRGFTNQPNNTSDGSLILREIVDGDAELLRRLTGESLAYLQWLVRFTEAEIKRD